MSILIVDFVVVHSRSISESLNISMQNVFKVSKGEGFQNGTCQKSEIGLEIER